MKSAVRNLNGGIAALLLAAVAASGPVAGAVGPAAAPVTPDAATAGEECEPGQHVLVPETPPAFAILRADRLAAMGTGAGVLIAVVDSGIDTTNPHLRDAVVGGVDLVGDGVGPFADPNGHGTVVAGIIGARPVAGSGLVGLAPQAALLSVRVYRAADEQSLEAGYGPTTGRIAAGIRYAADQGATIINVSLSSDLPDPALDAAVGYALSRGSLVVASAGNRETAEAGATDSPRYPAASAGALAVTAAGLDGAVTPASIHGPHVDVAAPGQDVLSAAPGGTDCYYAVDGPSTSYATAYASAAAALVAQMHPQDGPAGWEYRLMATAIRPDLDRRDDVNGWGLIDPLTAMQLLPDSTTRGPQSPFADTPGGPVRPEPVTVSPDYATPAATITRNVAVFGAIGGSTALGVLAVLLVLRSRRPAAPQPDAEADDHAEAGRTGFLDRSTATHRSLTGISEG